MKDLAKRGVAGDEEPFKSKDSGEFTYIPDKSNLASWSL